MSAQVALLRAVNVGGTGALSMAALREIGGRCGLANVRTYIASGNLLFDSDLEEGALAAQLEAALLDQTGKAVEVFIRTNAELEDIVATNPFPDAQGSRHMVFFFAAPPASDLIARCRDIRVERLALGPRELHVDYGEGIRASKLKVPDKLARTARNMNTVRKLAQLLRP